MPTGWRPADVNEKYPISYTVHASDQVKYETPASKALHAWSWFQYILLTLFMLHMMVNISDITYTQLFLYGSFLFIMIYSYTSLMDKDPNAIWMEGIKSIVGLAIIYMTGSWFLLDFMIPYGTTLVAIYQVLSALVVGYIVVNEIGWAAGDKQVSTQ